jgi:hypothetical protein
VRQAGNCERQIKEFVFFIFNSFFCFLFRYLKSYLHFY